MLIEFRGNSPKIESSVFLAEGVKIIGAVELRDNVNVWYNAVIRGDINKITIGKNSNIQENSTVHVSVDAEVVIGDNVTVGHNAIIHGCKIGTNCLIGMGAIVMDNAVIGEGSIVGAGTLVTENTIIPKNSLVLGSPGRVIKEIDVSKLNDSHAFGYTELAKKYKK